MKNWKPPRLSRGWRIVRNLALTLLILLYIWDYAGCPIPAPRLNFRRAERNNLVSPSDIQGVFRTEERNRCQWVVGSGEGQVLLLQSWASNVGTLYFWPKAAEGAALVPVPQNSVEFRQEHDIIAVDVPEGTASARLELTVGCWHPEEDLGKYQYITVNLEDFGPEDTPLWWEKTYAVEGKLLQDGGVLFRVLSDDEGMNLTENIAGLERIVLGQVNNWDTYDPYRSMDCSMEAVFYGKDGGELGRAALSTPEGGTDDAA